MTSHFVDLMLVMLLHYAICSVLPAQMVPRGPPRHLALASPYAELSCSARAPCYLQRQQLRRQRRCRQSHCVVHCASANEPESEPEPGTPAGSLNSSDGIGNGSSPADTHMPADDVTASAAAADGTTVSDEVCDSL